MLQASPTPPAAQICSELLSVTGIQRLLEWLRIEFAGASVNPRVYLTLGMRNVLSGCRLSTGDAGMMMLKARSLLLHMVRLACQHYVASFGYDF